MQIASVIPGGFKCFVFAAALGFSSARAASSSFETAYWAWQRQEPLSEPELKELAAQNAQLIYWHVGELEATGQTWSWKARFRFPQTDKSQIHYVPVVRIVSREREPFSPASLSALIKELSPVREKCDELQLDYDAPDRLLADYAAALKQIHQLFPRLSITALPHWARADCLKQLEPSVDELMPMLYDFKPEPVLQNHLPMALIDPDRMDKMLRDWKGCAKPWRAGLPAFARLTLYDAKGKLRGHIRNWNWDEICFNGALIPFRGMPAGTHLLRARKSTAIANARLQPDDQLIARWADRTALQQAISTAKQSGAQGVVLFRLPNSSASSGWSLHQLGHLEAKPELTFRKSDASESLELENSGDGDAEPRFVTEQSTAGGYTVEWEADAPVFREAQPGDFFAVTAYGERAGAFKPMAIPFATRLVFRFSHLRAQERLRTGLIQLAPGAQFRQTRYRVLNLEGASSWKSLE